MEKYIPDMYQKSIYAIDYHKLKNCGIRFLLFDLDEYYEAFTFNNDNIMVGREISRV